MPVYIGKRLLVAIPTLLIISIFVFSLQKLLPGDPVLAMAGEERDPASGHLPHVVGSQIFDRVRDQAVFPVILRPACSKMILEPCAFLLGNRTIVEIGSGT